MTYRKKAVNLLMQKMGVKNDFEAQEIVDLVDQKGYYKPSVFGILNAPEEIEDWDEGIKENEQRRKGTFLKANGCHTHLVLKIADAEQYLTDWELGMLEDICKKIEAGRLQDRKKIGNEYYICNKDEPYADEIRDIIETNEMERDEK